MKSLGTKQVAASGVMAALVCVATMLIAMPVPATQGFFNVGDAMIVVAALTFGPVVGAIAGGVGSSLADTILAYYNYAPFTLIIKGIEGFLIGWILSKVLHTHEETRQLMNEVEVDAKDQSDLQELKTKVSELKKKMGEVLSVHMRDRVLIAWFIGGLEMVAGYFTAQTLFLGYGLAGALVEVPVNLFQMAVAGLVGIPISIALRRTRIGAA